MTNIFNIIPQDIWVKLMVKYLNHKEIIFLCLTSKQFKTLYDNNNIAETIKYRGFPRSTGKCEYFDAYDFCDDTFGTHHEAHDDYYLDHVLNKLYDEGRDLVRGDKIAICNHDNNYYNIRYMFDGLKIVRYDYYNNYLPEGFNIIINDRFNSAQHYIPIDYWFCERYCCDFMKFDHTIVKEQCCNNIKLTKTSLFTTFIYNGEQYKIIAYDDLSRFIISQENFQRILSSNEKLILYVHLNYKKDFNLNLRLRYSDYLQYYSEKF
jgi:hypothetical protein